MNTSNLQLLNLPIRRDADGRYCLNDLHKAAGGLNHHRPSKWLANKQTQAQVAELGSEPEFGLRPGQSEARIRASNFAPIATVKGHGITATYIVKELVYAYAMWISPAFYIQVIRAYDALVTGQYVKPLTQAEKYWFTRRPHWQPIRALVFDGMTYATVAQRLGRSVGSVGRCIRRMIEVGLINPVEFIRLRYLPRTAERLVAANKQMCLDWGGCSMNHADLFPETLLVSRRGERIYTTSLKVAEFSSKRHTEVMRAIENKLKVLPASFRERNFALANYLDKQGKPRPMYEMTEEGFALTMMGFTGPESVQWQVEFIEAFMAQRAALTQMTARFAAALDQVRPNLRPVVEGTQGGLNRAAIAAPLGKSCASVSYHRNAARRLGLLARKETV